MATVITSECINCGACEPECPNASIYQGGAEWELDGVKHEPIAADIFYIVPEKCTECVGFHDKEACAAACPVDCCIPDPDRPESETVLLERAKKLHPERVFAADFPSRFRTPGAPQPPAAAPPKPAAKISAEEKAPAPSAPGPTPVVTAEPTPSTPAANKPTPPPAAGAASEQKAPAPVQPAPSTPTPVAAAPVLEARPAPADKPQKEKGPALPEMNEWEIPIECFRCHASYAVVFKRFRTGAVLYCPSCKGSYVVTSTMHNQVHRLLREFHDQWRRELEAAREKRPLESAAFEERQRRAVEQFDASLKALRGQQRAPGAPRKRAGIFG